MSTLEEISARIKVANENASQLNMQRQVNIGKREALQKQLDEALAQYKEKYGVE